MDVEGFVIPLWEPKWGQKQLEKRLSEIGERAFNRGYRQVAYSDADKLFRSFMQCVTYGVDVERLRKPNWTYFTGVDISGKKRKGNAIVTIALSGVFRYVVNCRRGNWSSLDTAKEIADVWDIYHPRLIMVERNATQMAIVDWMTESGLFSQDIPLEGYFTGGQKMDEIVGLPSLETELAQGLWKVCVKDRHLAACQCAMCEFISEANNYPYSTYSDMVMAWWFARQGMQKYWYIPERGKADSEEDEFGEDGTFLPPDLVSMLENTGDYAN